jgi:hypothetical protein
MAQGKTSQKFITQIIKLFDIQQKAQKSPQQQTRHQILIKYVIKKLFS